ncbi:MAG: Thiamine-phosphate synthase [Pelotomaculum sp. PtaB.Bin104]|nr:MAG: Thiamine-phosphate synthase [Pelotomaculum sp. PtaB.Bin104]
MELFRIIDANLNRAREGIRVVEEISRFYLNDHDIFIKLKGLRHQLIEGEKSLGICAITSRKSGSDVGNKPHPMENVRGDLREILEANANRVEESLRVLEEFSKIQGYSGELFKKARFSMYELEQEIFLKLPKPLDYCLYLATDDYYLKQGNFYDIVEQCLQAGVTVLQYRAKEKPAREMLDEALKLRKLTQQYNIPLIINDRLDLALAVDADGVHLGQDDLPFDIAKKYMGEKVIGISASSYEEGRAALLTGADYIGVGPVFETPTKKNANPICGLESITCLRKEFPTAKVIAIGGINLKNAAGVLAAGADGLAVISAILGSSEPARETAAFRKIIGQSADQHWENIK